MEVRSDVREFTGAMGVTIPRSVVRLNPYVLAGTGALDFRPTGNSGGQGVQSQTWAVFLYEGGANYDLTKPLMARVEYRGCVFERADFPRDSFGWHYAYGTTLSGYGLQVLSTLLFHAGSTEDWKPGLPNGSPVVACLQVVIQNNGLSLPRDPL